MTAFYLMGAVCFAIAVLLWAVIRGGKGEGAAEAKAEASEEKVAAVEKAAESDRKATERMANVQASSVSEPVPSARERMRKRPPGTR